MGESWVVAGREIHNPLDLLRRYCGLPWPGGRPEAWSFQYFDQVPLLGGPNQLTVTDVLACGSLVPQIQPRWYAWLYEQGLDQISEWARTLPVDVDLCDAGELELEQVFMLEGLRGAPLSLTSKLAHRLRPRLVPMYDATIGKCYDLIHGVRGSKGWPHFVRAFRDDLRANEYNLRYASEVLAGELTDAARHSKESLFGTRDWYRDPLPMTRILDIVLYVDDELRRKQNPVRRKQIPPRPPQR